MEGSKKNRRYGSGYYVALAFVLGSLRLWAQSAGSPASARFDLGPYDLKIDGRAIGQYKTGNLPDSGKSGQAVYEFAQDFAYTDAPARPSLLIGPNSYPYEILLNGHLVYSRGDPAGNGRNPTSYAPVAVPLDPEILARDGGRNRVEIRAYVTAQRNPLFRLSLTDYRGAEREAFFRHFFNIGLTQAAFVTGIILCLYFMFLFLLQRGRNLAYLWFALFSLAYSLCYANMTFNFPSNDFLLLEKVSRSSFPCVVVLMLCFLTEHLGVLRAGRLQAWLKAADALAASALAVPIWLQRSNVGVDAVFNSVMTYFILPNLLLCFGILLTAVIKSKFRKHLIILIAYVLIFAAAGHDISYVMSGRSPYAFLLTYGFLGLILSIFFVLAGEQSRVESSARQSAEALALRGEAMAKVMEKVSSVASGIVACTARLERVTAESVRGTTAYEEGSRSIQAEVGARFGDMEKAIAELSEGLERSGGILRDALRNQAALVLSMTESVEAMNRRVVSIKASTAGSEELAAHLSGIALESSGVIDQARTAIAKIEESSGFIRGVLDSINDISEQTSVLSINAAIEAARAGESGKGFTIVASSIRGLATKTKETVDSSLGNLSRMNELLATTGQLSESVSTVLGTIVEESGQTASKVKEASRDVDAQEGEFAAIMESTKRMAADQETIRVLSERDMEEKRSHLEILSSLKEGLLSISARINEQRTEGERLRAVAAELEAIMAESSSSVATLESILSVSKA